MTKRQKMIQKARKDLIDFWTAANVEAVATGKPEYSFAEIRQLYEAHQRQTDAERRAAFIAKLNEWHKPGWGGRR